MKSSGRSEANTVLPYTLGEPDARRPNSSDNNSSSTPPPNRVRARSKGVSSIPVFGSSVITVVVVSLGEVVVGVSSGEVVVVVESVVVVVVVLDSTVEVVRG